MKELYYDLKKQTWHQSFAQNERIGYGKYFSVPYKENKTVNHLSFPFRFQENKASPLVGILASPKKDGFIGNIGFFKRIQRTLHQRGGHSIIFTPEQLTENGLNGFCYLPSHNHWIKMKAPLPDVIYNRLYSHEDEDAYLEHIQNLAALYHIPLFNRQFFDKWELFLQLNNHNGLASHLPLTSVLSEETLEEYLYKFSAVYVKKRKSKKGYGISLIMRNGHTFLLRTTAASTMLFPSIKKLLHYFKKSGRLDSYIIQEAIQTQQIGGKKFDYRVLAHVQEKEFKVTGIGVRLAKTQQVTTHVPAGGIIVSVEDLPINTDRPLIEKLIKQCGKQLDSFYDYLGEFSADIGVTSDGHYYIFELNAKPMDFDEPVIKQACTEKLINVFYEFSQCEIKDFSF